MLAVFAWRAVERRALGARRFSCRSPASSGCLIFSPSSIWSGLIAEDGKGSLRRARIVCLVIAAASVSRSDRYIKFLRFPDRPIAEIDLPDNDWGRVMAWARSTPSRQRLARRSRTRRAVWDQPACRRRARCLRRRNQGCGDRRCTIAIVAMRTRDRLAELQNFDTMTPDARQDAAASAIDWTISSPIQQLDLPSPTRAVHCGSTGCDEPFVPKRRPQKRSSDDRLLLGQAPGVSRAPTAVGRVTSMSSRGTRVLAHCHWQPDAAAHPTLLALHGLEGSSAAHYMRGHRRQGVRARFNVILLNQRNCGGTEALSATASITRADRRRRARHRRASRATALTASSSPAIRSAATSR